MKKQICIVANGRLYDGIIREIKKDDMVIGVDRAAHWLIKHGIVPDVAIGDFDSVTEAEMEMILRKVKTIKHFQPEKDFTDTELAVDYAIRLHPVSITIFGGSGTRLDHTIGVMQLLDRPSMREIPCVFRDETDEIRVVGRGRTILYKREGCRYVSVLPITNTIIVSLSNFKYNIDKKTIRRGQTVGISNEFADGQAGIYIHRGKAFVIQSRD